MSKRANLYTGRAGQLAVMAELLLRGWNTAIPEVDIGDDIFVVRDRDGNLGRVQVKTAIAKETKSSVHVTYNLSLAQLETPITPEVTFVFAVRLGGTWNSFIVIDRPVLYEERILNNIGTERGDRLILRLRFQEGRVFCGDVDFTKYERNWSRFPRIMHE